MIFDNYFPYPNIIIIKIQFSNIIICKKEEEVISHIKNIKKKKLILVFVGSSPRVQWLRDGDANSKSLHSVMSSRRRHNALCSILVDSVVVEGVQPIHNVV